MVREWGCCASNDDEAGDKFDPRHEVYFLNDSRQRNSLLKKVLCSQTNSNNLSKGFHDQIIV